MNVRAIIKNNGKILLCHMKKDNFYFLPGGHIEKYESSRDAIFREFKEEMNINEKDIEIKEFIGLVEYEFEDIYGRDVLFEVSLKNTNIESAESHIDFIWKDINELKNIDFRPKIILDII